VIPASFGCQRTAPLSRLIEQDRRAEADVELQRALAFYCSVGATRYIRQAEGLLAESAREEANSSRAAVGDDTI
jgi:hypothetical protein